MSETRVIKRYANRKLYDTSRSRYVTLDQIAEMIRAGEDVQIVDNTTKEDLTSVTLAQIIYEEEKRQSSMPLQTMRNIIQSGGQSLTTLASQAGERVRSVFRSAESEQDPAPERAEAPPASEPSGIRGFFDKSQAAFDEWQRKIDERIRHTLEGLSPFSGLEKEIRTLSERLADLEQRVIEHDDHDDRK